MGSGNAGKKDARTNEPTGDESIYLHCELGRGSPVPLDSPHSVDASIPAAAGKSSPFLLEYAVA